MKCSYRRLVLRWTLLVSMPWKVQNIRYSTRCNNMDSSSSFAALRIALLRFKVHRPTCSVCSYSSCHNVECICAKHFASVSQGGLLNPELSMRAFIVLRNLQPTKRSFAYVKCDRELPSVIRVNSIGSDYSGGLSLFCTIPDFRSVWQQFASLCSSRHDDVPGQLAQGLSRFALHAVAYYANMGT